MIDSIFQKLYITTPDRKGPPSLVAGVDQPLNLGLMLTFNLHKF